MDDVNAYLHYAEIAFANKQYMEALSWYRKVLSEKPDDLYALSRAGAIAVSMGQFDLALECFRRAKELDSQNGDNHFNYGNACFFKKDFAGAFASYVNAEKCGCSDDVSPRLYYQMALLCSLRQDTKSALVYFKKCEECDITGELSLSPDLISEKLKLYMLTQDYSNAEKAAAQLVAIQPTLFRNYMVYFSILMAHKSYAEAEKLLEDAARYADTSADDRINITLQTASLYVARGEADAANREEFFKKAKELLEAKAHAEDVTPAQLINILLTLSEVYQKADLHDQAISCLMYLLDGIKAEKNKSAEEVHPAFNSELTYDEIDEMLRQDMERIQELIYSGEIDENMGAYAEVVYDEAGYPVRVFDDSAFSALPSDQAAAPQENTVTSEENADTGMSLDQRERVLFMLLSSYLAKNEFTTAGKLAEVLKHSDNQYYSYYGRYVSALATRKTTYNPAAVAQKYAETLAYFRSKMFADHTDTLAAIFRARLYAEDGKKEKAKEIAKLLADADQKAVMDYIATLSND